MIVLAIDPPDESYSHRIEMMLQSVRWVMVNPFDVMTLTITRPAVFFLQVGCKITWYKHLPEMITFG
jgi:hypothetical protein